MLESLGACTFLLQRCRDQHTSYQKCSSSSSSRWRTKASHPEKRGSDELTKTSKQQNNKTKQQNKTTGPHPNSRYRFRFPSSIPSQLTSSTLRSFCGDFIVLPAELVWVLTMMSILHPKPSVSEAINSPG